MLLLGVAVTALLVSCSSADDRRPASLLSRSLTNRNIKMAHPRTRVRRTSSDQRLAELQALATLGRGRASMGHGRIDPFLYGKRKRTGILRDYLILSPRRYDDLDSDYLYSPEYKGLQYDLDPPLAN